MYQTIITYLQNNVLYTEELENRIVALRFSQKLLSAGNTKEVKFDDGTSYHYENGIMSLVEAA